MKKTFYSYNFPFFVFLALQIFFTTSTVIFTLHLAAGDGSYFLYVLLGVAIVALFTAFLTHYGSIRLHVTDNSVGWTKEVFLPKREAPSVNRYLFALAGTDYAGVNTKESFSVGDIAEYGLLEDFSGVKIKENIQVLMISRRVIVFRMKNGDIKYFNTYRFFKVQIKNFLTSVRDVTGIEPSPRCRDFFEL